MVYLSSVLSLLSEGMLKQVQIKGTGQIPSSADGLRKLYKKLLKRVWKGYYKASFKEMICCRDPTTSGSMNYPEEHTSD